MKNTEKQYKERSEYSVQAVTNAIRLLEELGESDHEQSVQELREKLDLTKSNVLKLLHTLEMFEYVDINKYTGNYGLGVRTFQISQAYINNINLVEVALPIQKALRTTLGESVYLGVLRRANIVYLSVVETELPVRVIPRIGNIGPAYATATGKVQLSHMEDTEIAQLYEQHEFTKYTDKTIKSMSELMLALNEARKNGYAMDDEEYEIGVRCVAAPVINFMGNVIAAISVTAPLERFSDKVLESKVLPALKNAAEELSVKFGYRKK